MFKDPFSFEGRIRRKEYVITFLILYIISFGLGYALGDGVEGIYLWLILILLAASVWIQLAQNTKRCHDINRSGWYQLIPFYTLYLLFAEGDKFRNQYGPSPKYTEVEEE
ncbi:MAG TPA: DUF805 domain-containing protein [Mucilaginibacter sp.]|jgi:uncharacterized membrane protein YhaH (DUF805 family)|nr:DUF805 domain-containing protein [Mucilaginibacter sp.]